MIAAGHYNSRTVRLADVVSVVRLEIVADSYRHCSSDYSSNGAMEIDWIWDSNGSHSFLRCSFGCSCRLDADCCSCSSRVAQCTGCIVDQMHGDCSVIEMRDGFEKNLSNDEEQLFHLHVDYCLMSL